MGAIYTLYQLFSGTKKRWFYALLTGLLIAASFMSKGPVSIYALFLPLILAQAISGSLKGLKNNFEDMLIFFLLTSLYLYDSSCII